MGSGVHRRASHAAEARVRRDRTASRMWDVGNMSCGLWALFSFGLKF